MARMPLMSGKGAAMTPRREAEYWSELEANAHLPEVQAIIRREIIKGAIRVRATSDDGIGIVSTDGHEPFGTQRPAEKQVRLKSKAHDLGAGALAFQGRANHARKDH
jgi:hypothetical protein